MIFKTFGKKSVVIGLICVSFFVFSGLISLILKNEGRSIITNGQSNEEKIKFIKYAEFNIPFDILEKTMKLDILSEGKETKIKWIDVLAFLSAKYGGDFRKNYKNKDLDDLKNKIEQGSSVESLSEKMKHYNYYHQVYTAVLGEFLGKHSVEVDRNNETNEPIFEEKYGLKVFSPIAKSYPYNHYKDFGAARTYGYSRPHLGHDMMAATGTPVVAIESGIVEILGWNQYGGWRVGIRSFDKKRYYYYAHLRKDIPFQKDLVQGKVVKAGDVIGYVGRTGYSCKENVNNIETSHLHVGLELIFDESQKESNNEIWVDLYDITQLLEKNRSLVRRVENSKHFEREKEFKEPLLCQ